jgi:hypothetical protein
LESVDLDRTGEDIRIYYDRTNSTIGSLFADSHVSLDG